MASLKVSSPAFEFGQQIPQKYTCDGKDVNPPLHIENIPGEAISLVVIVDDPDAPARTWNHWIAWNIPVVSDIPEGTSLGVSGVNDFRKEGYNGPCPPYGVHRYYYKVYAINQDLRLKRSEKKRKLLNTIKNSILAKGELVGLYGRD